MKRKSNLIPLALLCGMLLTGFTRSVAQDVTVGLNLPWSGNYNDWIITFTGSGGNFEFYTNDDNYESHILGTLPAGTYNVEFNGGGFPDGFDFWFVGPTFEGHRVRSDSFTWYGVVIEEGTYLQIDEGY